MRKMMTKSRRYSLFCLFFAFLLVLSVCLTGCGNDAANSSKSKTMFDIMRQEQAIEKGTYSVDLTTTQEENSVKMTVSGAFDTKNSAYSMDISMETEEISGKFISIILKDGQLYFDLNTLLSAMNTGITIDQLSAMLLQSGVDAETAASIGNISLGLFDFGNADFVTGFRSLSSKLTDACEKSLTAGKPNAITEKEGTFSLSLTAEELTAVSKALLTEVNQNLESWYDEGMAVVKKLDFSPLLTEIADAYQQISGETMALTSETLLANIDRQREAVLSKAKESLQSAMNQLDSVVTDNHGTMEMTLSSAGNSGSTEYTQTVTCRTDSEEVLKMTHRVQEANVTIDAPEKSAKTSALVAAAYRLYTMLYGNLDLDSLLDGLQ